ncbi:MAG TPA: hypothetical protein VF095_00560 [Bacillota bacterium]
MEQYFLSIEQLNEKLHEWKGFPIKIEKIELRDKDEIRMQLNDIHYTKNTQTEDDYKGMYALQLNGSGKIQTSNAYAPLPEEMYEIPLEESSLYEYDGSQFLLSTERGVYKIERLQE